MTLHSTEEEVVHAVSYAEGSKERNAAFENMRKNGILQYNKKQAKLEDPKYASERKDHADIICSKCKGFYGKRLFYRHREVCAGDSIEYPHKMSVQTINETTNQEFTQEILSRFQDNETGRICRTDPALLLVGKRQFQKSKKKVDKVMECRKSVMQDMRLLATLYKAFKEYVPSITSEEMFHRSNFDHLEQAIEDTTTREEGKLKHGVKHSLLYLIRTVVDILIGNHAKDGNDDRVDELQKFLYVYNLHVDRIFGDAVYAINLNRQEKLRMPEQQADEGQVDKLRNHLIHVIEETTSEYTMIGQHEFVSLRDSLCSRLTLFNARRGGEPSRLKLSHFVDAVSKRWINKAKVLELPEWERRLCDELLIAYQPGKGNHLVPVLIPSDCLKGLDIISNTDTREIAGVSDSNTYLFPNTNKSPDHVIGWDATNKMCLEAGVCNPNQLTASKQRHRISTIYCALGAPENEREYFYKHMGHTKDVNLGTYQYPLPIMEITKVGRHLQNIDKG